MQYFVKNEIYFKAAQMCVEVRHIGVCSHKLLKS